MSAPSPNSSSDDVACCGCFHLPIFANARHTTPKSFQPDSLIKEAGIETVQSTAPTPEVLPINSETTSAGGNTSTQGRETDGSRGSVILNRSQAPLVISKTTSINHGNEDMQSRETRDETTSTDHGSEDAQNWEAGDRSDPVISPRALPSLVSPIIPASTNHEDDDSRTREAAGSADPILATTTEAPTTVAIEPPSIAMFPGASNFQIKDTTINPIAGDATFIRFGDGQFTEVQRDLIGDYIAKHIVLPAINDNSKKHLLTQLVVLLPRAEAVFNDYQTKKKAGPCFEGTRVALLREMADWVTSQDESRMYILSGLAGIGKSTVAYTIASRAADLNLLGASFFFSREEADRNNAKKLFTTIAYQLCVYDERFSEAIGDALRAEPAGTTKAPLEQLRVLILDPLRSIVQSHARPILVIVDALDECCEEDVRAVIQGLGQLVRDLSSFRVILTTRPRPLIDHFLFTNQGHKLFRLQDIEDKIVDSDIRLYLRYKLSLEAVQELYPGRRWCASDEEIDALVRAAGRLFIIASTSVRYILDEWASNPAAQMQELLRAWAQDRIPLQDLDRFYTVILRNVVPANCDNHNIVKRYQSILGAIILVQRPLSVSTLAHLIDTDPEDIRTVLHRLQSVIILDDDVPRVYHKSFPDYLKDKARCKDSQLQIDPSTRHKQIVMRCFEIAKKHLKYNILGLGTPARFMSNKEGLKEEGITEEQLQEKIPQQLHYACIYWVAHLDAAIDDGNIDNDITNELDKFINGHMLHWFEVLSIIGKLDTAHRAIRTVLKLLKSLSLDLNQLLSDALRFISKFYELINQSALHTYYSALPFSPTDSLLYRQYIKDAAHGICDIEGGPQKWDALVADLGCTHPQLLDVVKFSLNSDMLVSYSNGREYHQDGFSHPGELKLWDAFTGTPISTIPGDRFAISSDFSIIASSKKHIITYYNHDGNTTGAKLTISSTIKQLSLSSETNRVAAALFDGTVRLWECSSSELIDTFKVSGFCSWLQFSPFGGRLVYSTGNGILKLRDGISGRFIADLHCGWYNHLKFSADGSRFASLSHDRGLKLWNCESGGLVGAVRNVGYMKLAISANGSLLATVDRDDIILWSENGGQLIKIKVLESYYPTSMTFSLNDQLVIGGSSISIYNIETQAMSTLLRIISTGPMAISPDGIRISTGVHLFDAQAIHTSSSPSGAYSRAAIALSRDCSRLACGFHDGTVELWETSPTMKRISSHKSDRYEMSLEFGPDGRLFASWSYWETIKLWNGGDGSLLGTLEGSYGFSSVALSRGMLTAARESQVKLWNLDTLSLVHTFSASDKKWYRVSISDKGDLAAIRFDNGSVDLFDLENHTCIATFEFGKSIPRNLTFLPDKSHLVGHIEDEGKFLSLNLFNKRITDEPLLEHLIQIPNIPFWHGVPLLPCHEAKNSEPRYVGALFSQTQRPVPVLWIPTDITAWKWAQRSSLIALGCEYRDIILLRLRAD